MKEAGIVQIRTSILRRQNTVAQFIATRPILDLCKKAKRQPGARVPMRWWEQTDIDWKGAREGRSSSISGGAGIEGVYGLGVRGRRRYNVQDCKRHGGGGVPGRKRLQWSGAED